MNEFQMKFIMRRSRKLRKQQFQSFRDRLRSKKQTSRSKSTSKGQAGPKQIRHRESGILYVLNPDGSLRRGEVTDSSWWVNYVILPEELLTSRLKKKFRDRFRMPYSERKKFVDKLNEHELFSRWKRGKTDALGKPCSSIELLTLGVLKKLGKECTFD